MILRGKELVRSKDPKRNSATCLPQAAKAVHCRKLRPRLQEKGGTQVPPGSLSKTSLVKRLFSALGVPVGVDGREAGPFLRQILESKNGGHGGKRDAGAAIDAFRRGGVQLRFRGKLRLIFARVDAIHRADIHTGGVFCADARLGNHVSHSRSPLLNFRPGLLRNPRNRQKSPYIMRPLRATSGYGSIVRGGDEFLNREGNG